METTLNIKINVQGIKEIKRKINDLKRFNEKFKRKYVVVHAFKFSKRKEKVISKLFMITKKQAAKMIEDSINGKNTWQDFNISIVKKKKEVK